MFEGALNEQKVLEAGKQTLDVTGGLRGLDLVGGPSGAFVLLARLFVAVVVVLFCAEIKL